MASAKSSEPEVEKKKKVKKLKKEKELEDAAAEIKALKKALRKAEKEKKALAEVALRSPRVGTEVRRSPRLAAIAMAEMPPLMLLPGKRPRESDSVASPPLKSTKISGDSHPAARSATLSESTSFLSTLKRAKAAPSLSSPTSSASTRSSTASSSAQTRSSTSSSSSSAEDDALLESKQSAVKILSSAEYQKLHSVRVIIPPGSTVTSPEPIQSFDQARKFFNESLMKAVTKEGFLAPSPIQAMSWPFVMAGSDIIAVAKTGSGKTVGFLFPAFVHIVKNYSLAASPFSRDITGPVAIVVAPTRELVVQIELEAQKFSKAMKIQCACVYGGVPKGPQIFSMKRGIHVVIATPGRLNDFLAMKERPVTNLKRCTYVVLDEADRMLDMGFEPQIRSIFAELPAGHKHQTLMFSATWPKGVQTLAREFLKTPVQINIGGDGDTLSVNSDVTQEFFQVPEYEKQSKLVEILEKIQGPDLSCIVFANKKSDCDNLAFHIRRKMQGFNATSIHGDKDQYQRTEALQRFVEGKDQIIVATDVAARGLDIKGVSHVINFDFPSSGVEDWVHRVGRTGRAGKKGTAFTFLNGANTRYAAELVQILTAAKQPIPDFLSTAAKRSPRSGGGGGGRWGGGGRGGAPRGRGGKGSWSSGGRYGGGGGDFGGGDRFSQW